MCALPAVCFCAENDYRSDAFTSSHIQLLQLLCSQAALSIDNARLYGALSEYNASLEQQVHGRTAELEQKNKQLSMAKEVAEAATKAKADFLSNMVTRSIEIAGSRVDRREGDGADCGVGGTAHRL